MCGVRGLWCGWERPLNKMSTSLSWVIVLTFVCTSVGFTVGSRQSKNDTAPANRHGCVGVVVGARRARVLVTGAARACGVVFSFQTKNLHAATTVSPTHRPTPPPRVFPHRYRYTLADLKPCRNLYLFVCRRIYTSARPPPTLNATVNILLYVPYTRCRYMYIYFIYTTVYTCILCVYPRYLRSRLPLFF